MSFGESMLGEQRVRYGFRIKELPLVKSIKSDAAQIINLINNQIEATDGESARLKSLAMTAFEEGAMWAVKAATYPAPEEGKEG